MTAQTAKLPISLPNGSIGVVALVPSAGMGGGIERYWDTMQAALRPLTARISVVPVLRPGREAITPMATCRFAYRAVTECHRLRHYDRRVLIVLHPSLSVLAWLLKIVAGRRVAEIKV